MHSKRNGTVDYTTSDSDVKDCNPLFNELFLGAQYQTVDPHSFILFARLREPPDSVMKRLICLFYKTSAQPDGGHSTELSLVSLMVRFTLMSTNTSMTRTSTGTN